MSRYLLPREAYWSQEWFEKEQRLIFSRSWHLAAAESELAQPGDYVTLTAGADPLVVVRGTDGELRCFHNLCRHRGMALVEGSGNTGGGIGCPYHQWNYNLVGLLRNVPQKETQFPEIDLADWGLFPASVETWAGMVFAHPDPHSAPVASWLDALPEHIGGYQPDLLPEVAHERLEAKCNWKLFVENHVDVLHLWFLHAGTLSDFDHGRFEWEELGTSWVSYEPLKPATGSKLAATTVAIRHIEERDINGLGAHIAFPNLMMASAAEFFMTYVAVPVAPDRTIIDVRIRAEPDADREKLAAAATSFIHEDIWACEGVQAGVRSSRYAVGPLAVDHERPITIFQRHLLEALEPRS